MPSRGFLTAEELYQIWLTNETVSIVDKRKMQELSKKEIQDLFKCDGSELQFGTSGIRAIVGVGPKRWNIHTFRVFAEAYAQFLKSKPEKSPILIGYDNREHGKTYAKAIWKVLSFNGIPAVISAISIATPILAFYIKKKQFKGGLMITASHNPPEYNGVKLYNEKGGQLSKEEEARIRSLFRSPEDYLNVSWNSISKITTVSNECFNTYAVEIQRALVSKLGSFYSLGSTIIRTIKFLFSSHHGTSSRRMSQLAKMMGSEQFKEYCLECTPIFTFSNSEITNPELPESFKNMEKEAVNLQIDYLMAHDPDSDRSATAEFGGKSWYYFTGNEMAILLASFLLELANNPKYKVGIKYKYLITTFVSGDFIDKVVQFFNPDIKIIRTETGFKSIGHMIEQYSRKGDVLFGCEEAIGISIFPSLSLEKDGFQQTIVTMYMIGYYKFQSKNLTTQLYWLMWELKTIWFGKTITFNVNDLKKKKYIYEKLTQLSKNKEYIKVNNLDLQVILGAINGIFIFKLKSADSWIKARFSGTEPKFKLYFNLYWPITDQERKEQQTQWKDFIEKRRAKLERTSFSIAKKIYRILQQE